MCFLAKHPDTGEELGYIQFIENRGILEFANYRAQLSGDTLGIGSSDKKEKSYLAGGHGEGYKLAALTLTGEGFKIYVKASRCEWNFYMAPAGKKHVGFVCVKLVPRNNNVLEANKRAAKKRELVGTPKSRNATANIWEDASFQIKGRKMEGDKIKSILTKEEVLKWTELAVDR